MAGIGFELRRMTLKSRYSGILRAYASAAVISAGPWIISIMSLMLLTYLLDGLLSTEQVRLFTSSTTHVYAIALILAGPIQLVLTRYTSDCFSAKRREAVFPSFIGAILLTIFVVTAVGGLFFMRFVPAPPLYQIAATALLVHVACIFIASTFLSALREYNRIVFAFFIGYGVGVAAAWYLAKP